MGSRSALIDDLGGSQLGLVTYGQLRAACCSPRQIRGMVARGELREKRAHVYVAAGAPRTHDQDVLAAVLAAGKTAFASHETAAHIWQLPVPHPAALEITVVIERWARLEGVRVHRSGLLIDPDVMTLAPIPISSPERTIVDLSSRLSLSSLGRMTDDALRRRLTSLGRIKRTAERLGRAPGRSPKKVAEMLARRIPGVEQRDSVLEDFVFDALRRFALPLPVPQYEVEVRGHKRRLDLAYPCTAVMLDVLGYDYHGMRERFDADAGRRNDLRDAGWRIVEVTSSFTDWQIAGEVARALGRPEPTRSAPQVTFLEWQGLR
jgi:hypothetical protein